LNYWTKSDLSFSWSR